MADLLRQRGADLSPPIQMCDALTRNLPKELKVILANCNAHARRQFVALVEKFPDECRYVIETLAEVYKYDALAKEKNLSKEERLKFHQEMSGPLIDRLHDWFTAQFELRKVEPNSSLGEAIAYSLKHWEKLTLFLRQAGAPLDNNEANAASGISFVMPTSGLCRVVGFQGLSRL